MKITCKYDWQEISGILYEEIRTLYWDQYPRPKYILDYPLMRQMMTITDACDNPTPNLKMINKRIKTLEKEIMYEKLKG